MYLDIGIVSWTAKEEAIHCPLKWLYRSELVQEEGSSDNNSYDDGDVDDNDDDDCRDYDDEDDGDFDNDDHDHSKLTFHTLCRAYLDQHWRLLGIL